MNEEVIVAAAAILAIGVAAQWLGWRLRVPAIVFFLLAGLLVGPVTGVLEPDEILGDLLFPVVSMAVAVILFEGGLALGVDRIRHAGSTVWKLLSIGAGITLTSTALAAWLIFDIEPELAWLLAAVLVVTGPTVIGPLVRSIGLRGRLASILEAEGTLIDPMGAILAVLFFEGFFEEDLTESWPVELATTLGIGLLAGLLGAGLIVWTFGRYLVPDQLHNPMTLATVLTVFAAADHFQPEAGLVGVTIMGVAIASQNKVDVQHVLVFNETLRTLFIAGLFILLGARISADTLSSLGWLGLLFLVVLVVLVRPVSVFASTIGSGLELRERTFIALTAPRGIVAASVASIFSLRLTDNDIEGAQVLVAATFTVIAGTVLFSGLLARPLAGRLQLVETVGKRTVILGSNRLARELAHTLASLDTKVTLIGMDRKNLSDARMEGLTAYYGSVMNDETWQEAEVDNARLFVAMSSQDEVNALASNRAAELIGRRNVFQLVPKRRGRPRRVAATRTHGRGLFAPDASIDKLDARLEAGWEISATKLSEEFKSKEYFAEHPAAMPLCAVRPNGVHMHDAGQRLAIRPGDTVVSLLPPSDHESRTEQRRSRSGNSDGRGRRGRFRSRSTDDGQGGTDGKSKLAGT